MPEIITTPYSQPVGSAVASTVANPGLYCPPEQRRPVSLPRATPHDLLAGNGPLPWIDAFLAATPAAGVAVIAPPREGNLPGASPSSARSASPSESRAESAAQTLELLALRVRAGELSLAGYDPALGDAAALVTALAAVLGVRLGE